MERESLKTFEDLLNQGRAIIIKADSLLNGYITYLRKAATTHPHHDGGSSKYLLTYNL